MKNETGKFFLIAGPCLIESEEMAFQIASEINDITKKLGIEFIFKGSYRKANRSRLDSYTRTIINTKCKIPLHGKQIAYP